MNSKFLYLLLDIGSFIVPFAFSFHPKVPFAKKWRYYIPAIITTGTVFVLWDEYFTQRGYWGFNPDYTTGVYVGTLPVEEILFFLCIPYACCFTYFAFKNLFQKDLSGKAHRVITATLIGLSVVIALASMGKAYTVVTFFSLAAVLIFEGYVLKGQFMGKFYFTYLILLVPFFIVNGILTGSLINEPVVWYNDDENLGIRVGTVPVEDIFYGMLMILLSVAIAERLESASIKKAPDEGSLNATK